jgi:hypothetical protein
MRKLVTDFCSNNAEQRIENKGWAIKTGYETNGGGKEFHAHAGVEEILSFLYNTPKVLHYPYLFLQAELANHWEYKVVLWNLKGILFSTNNHIGI